MKSKHKAGVEANLYKQLKNNTGFFFKSFQKLFIFIFWLCLGCAQTPRFLAGGAKSTQTTPVSSLAEGLGPPGPERGSIYRGQGPLDPSSVPFATYLCFDTVIIGSEVSFFFTERERERERNRGADNLAPRRPRQLIVALGFLEGLLLKGAGAYGWASQDEFAADTAAANALGGLVDTLPLNQFLIGPFVVLAVSALITSIDFQLNEIEKEEDALLSDLVYSPEAKTSELAQGRCSRFTFEL